MRRAQSWLLAGVLALGGAGGAFLVGCGSPGSTQGSRPASTELADGLTVLDAVPTSHVDLAYKAGGHVVYLQTRVGPLKPQVYRDQFPDQPLYEMDTRLVDENGHTFTLVVGGDKVIDSTWGSDMAAGEKAASSDPAVVAMYFAMGRDAGAAFAALNRPELADHAYHLGNATRVLPSERTQLITQSNQAMAAALAAGAQRPLDSIGYHYLIGELYGECIYLCIGHHSTVWGWDGNYDFTNASWSWTNNIVACNHGPCANSSSLSYEGASYSGGSSDFIPSANTLAAMWSDEPTGSNTVYTAGHGCQTNYNWDTPPGHECNDDSAFELQQIHDSPSNYGYGNSSFGNGSNFCHKYGSDGNACSCSSSCNSCSGDWSFPPIP